MNKLILISVFFLCLPCRLLFAYEEQFSIYSKQELVGALTAKIEKIKLDNENVTYVETLTVSKVNRWFPGKEVKTIDKEWLDGNYRIIKFKSEVVCGSHRIFLEGERVGDKLFITQLNHKGKTRRRILPMFESSCTSGALRFVYKENGLFPDRKYNIHLLDKKSCKWRKIKVKVGDLTRVGSGAGKIDVYPVKTKYMLFYSNISYIDESGNLIYSNAKGTEFRKVY
jgi:hypothetical protein